MIDLKAHIRTVPDYPKKGILFYDIATLLAHGPAWRETIARMGDLILPAKPEMIVGIESRGFLIGAALAAHLGVGFGMIRKKGKLPGETRQRTYDLEYGQDTIEIQHGIFAPGARAVLCDDLLATGGTAAAAIHLAREIGLNVVQAAFIIELDFLNGRTRLDVPAASLLHYAN